MPKLDYKHCILQTKAYMVRNYIKISFIWYHWFQYKPFFKLWNNCITVCISTAMLILECGLHTIFNRALVGQKLKFQGVSKHGTYFFKAINAMNTATCRYKKVDQKRVPLMYTPQNKAKVYLIFSWTKLWTICVELLRNIERSSCGQIEST